VCAGQPSASTGIDEASRQAGWGSEVHTENQTFKYYAGIDWASESYQVCVVDDQGKVLAEKQVEHSGDGIRHCIEWLLNLADEDARAVAVAIEVPHGAMVESLIENNLTVFAINPKQMDRFRDRHTVAGAKDDDLDAFVMADSLRTDQPCFHRVELDEPALIRLRELSRMGQDLQTDSNRLANQLWEQLRRYYPQMLKLSPGADEVWLWELLALAPLPGEAAKLKLAKVKAILGAHRIRRITAEQVLEQLRQPALRLAPGAAEAASEHVQMLLPRLHLLKQQQEATAQRIQRILEELCAAPPECEGCEHRDAKILLSLPGIGPVIAATMLAEASQPLRERDYQALRNYAGAGPVTRRSGKRKVVLMRYACNERLRNALYHWSRTSMQKDPRAKQHYAELRHRGHSHGRALRGLADRNLAMLIAMLKSGTLYDPAKRTRAAVAQAG
jgi:transposase